MSRREAVVLVCRALAVIQLVSAALDCTYLPEWFISYAHHVQRTGILSPAEADLYYIHLDHVHLAFLLLRIAGLLVLAAVLWNCGPWLERILLPRPEGSSPQV